MRHGGYILDKNEPRSRQEIIDYFLQIIIYPAEKTFAMIGNVTCAAAVSSIGRLSTRQEFFADFGQSKPEYEEYKRQICVTIHNLYKPVALQEGLILYVALSATMLLIVIIQRFLRLCMVFHYTP